MSCNKCNLSPCNCYASVPTIPCGPQIPCIQYIPQVCPVSSNLLFAKVSTINLEFFAMPMVPKILVAAPGVNKQIVPLQIWNEIVPSNPAIPYQDAGTNTPTLVYSLGTFGIASDSSILGSVVDTTTHYAPFSGTLAGNLSNQPLTISTLTQPVVGDSILYSYIVYTIVNI